MSNEKEYSDFGVVLENFKRGNKCYQFLSAPLQYDNINEIKGEWLSFIQEDDLAVLLENKEIRKMLVGEFKKNPNQYGTKFRKKILKMVFGDESVDSQTFS